MEIVRKMSNAYWPRTGFNDSADRISGDAAVDKLTIGELAQFYKECTCGPTYCMVTRRVQELLQEFPPHVENKRQRVVDALAAAEHAYLSLKSIVE
jgi:hypothetical protein